MIMAQQALDGSDVDYAWTMSPITIQSLPTELLIHVFRLVIPPQDALILLAQVCRRWSYIALDTPDLWRSLTWSNDISPSHTQTGLYQLILHHGQHLSHLSISFTLVAFSTGESPFWVPLRWDTYTWQPFLAHLSNLTILSLNLTNHSRLIYRRKLRPNLFLHFLSLSCPKLVRFSFGDACFETHFTAELFYPDPPTGLPCTVLGPTLPLLAIFLRRLRNLTHLRLIGCESLRNDNTHVFQPALLTTLATELGPRLRDFANYRPESFAAHVTNTIRLDSDADDGGMKAWTAFCDACTGLERWHFGLCESIGDKHMKIWGRKKKVMMREMSLRTATIGGDTWTLTDRGLMEALKACPGLEALKIWRKSGEVHWQATITDRLIAHLPLFCPNLTTIHLWSLTPEPLQLSTLDPLTHLQHLTTLVLCSCPSIPRSSLPSFLLARARHTSSHKPFSLHLRDTDQSDDHRIRTAWSLATDDLADWRRFFDDPRVRLGRFDVKVETWWGVEEEEVVRARFLDLEHAMKDAYGQNVALEVYALGRGRYQQAFVVGHVKVSFWYE
ncbi:hypothetical protein BC938DRAFT_478919 [Jimgerdemannia flammicorona]|uniref:F-box domain-containing protein n=1 Tax=Jimgerdemannia flammicorona TaxID=994334 RepID=A0A433QM18_9FUNG|nr:hypothetical protein BC938DRAFT_478919 [Jimgerdemannia flammicorona]